MPVHSIDGICPVQAHPRKGCINKYVKYNSGVIKQDLSISVREEMDKPGEVLFHFCIEDSTSSGFPEIVKQKFLQHAHNNGYARSFLTSSTIVSLKYMTT